MTLAELRQRMSVDELLLWEEWYELNPWDGRRLDYLFALVCLVVYSLWRSKGSPRLKLEDFLLPWGGQEAKAKRTPQELIEKLRMLAKATGGYRKKANAKSGGAKPGGP